MRILIDYRPALRERTGVGEYVHQLAAALARRRVDRLDERPAPEGRASVDVDHVDLFTSSWKDRPSRQAAAEVSPAQIVDRRVPVRLLNLLWHRLEVPPVELLLGRSYDVAHSPHPLLLPTRRAAQVVTIHDLDFLYHPERTSAEVRRDYRPLAADHARRADAIVVPSGYVGRLVQSTLNVDASRVTVCAHGTPKWSRPAPAAPGNPTGKHLLFLGTLEPRKNIAGLLEAYGRLVTACPDAPPLILAGGAPDAAQAWLDALGRPPLAGRAEYRGYVSNAEREQLLRDARLLVLPSFDEGFGLPLLEAMSLGIPAVAADRGALPEVAGSAAVLVDPDDPDSICCGLREVLDHPEAAQRRSEQGLMRAAEFTWEAAAALTRQAYEKAIETRRRKTGGQ